MFVLASFASTVAESLVLEEEEVTGDVEVVSDFVRDGENP